MIAAGMQSGEVNVFQIQKEHPPELTIVAPLTKSRPIERYIIGGSSRATITAMEWSKNAMKLFSGDRQGLIVMTEFDFTAHVSKSCDILNESYAIVQIGFQHPWLLVSSVYRTIICEMIVTSASASWRISQIGKKDRKVLSKFGAVFTGNDRRAPAIICSRPSYRFWSANTSGDVSHTFLLKDAVLKDTYDVPLLNPGPMRPGDYATTVDGNFGPCYNYRNAYILTHNEHTIFIINLEKLKVEATVRRLRRIHSLAICDWEIFVLEGGRSLVRLSILPEQIRDGSVVYNVNYGAPSAYVMKPLLEFEAEEETITKADECFELPPIEHIDLDTELRINKGANSTQDKILLEHSLKTEVFDRINQMQYDNTILFRTGLFSSKKKRPKSNVNGGIVEVGQQAMPSAASESDAIEETTNSHNETITTTNQTNNDATRYIEAQPPHIDQSSAHSVAAVTSANSQNCDNDNNG